MGFLFSPLPTTHSSSEIGSRQAFAAERLSPHLPSLQTIYLYIVSIAVILHSSMFVDPGCMRSLVYHPVTEQRCEVFPDLCFFVPSGARAGWAFSSDIQWSALALSSDVKHGEVFRMYLHTLFGSASQFRERD